MWTSPTVAGLFNVQIDGFVDRNGNGNGRASTRIYLKVYNNCLMTSDQIKIVPSMMATVTINVGTSGSSYTFIEFT